MSATTDFLRSRCAQLRGRAQNHGPFMVEDIETLLSELEQRESDMLDLIDRIEKLNA